MTTEAVKKKAAWLLSFTQEEAEAITPAAEEAILFVERQMREGADPEDPRLTALAGAYCACQAACARQGEPLASFAAGDVKFTRGECVEACRAALELCRMQAAELIQDGGFRFQAV